MENKKCEKLAEFGVEIQEKFGVEIKEVCVSILW